MTRLLKAFLERIKLTKPRPSFDDAFPDADRNPWWEMTFSAEGMSSGTFGRFGHWDFPDTVPHFETLIEGQAIGVVQTPYKHPRRQVPGTDGVAIVISIDADAAVALQLSYEGAEQLGEKIRSLGVAGRLRQERLEQLRSRSAEVLPFKRE